MKWKIYIYNVVDFLSGCILTYFILLFVTIYSEKPRQNVDLHVLSLFDFITISLLNAFKVHHNFCIVCFSSLV